MVKILLHWSKQRSKEEAFSRIQEKAWPCLVPLQLSGRSKPTGLPGWPVLGSEKKTWWWANTWWGERALRSRERWGCPCPSPAAALGRVGIDPHLGNTVQLALVAEVDASPALRVWKQKNQSRPLLIAACGEAGGQLADWPILQPARPRTWVWARLPQHPPIYDELEHWKQQDL